MQSTSNEKSYALFRQVLPLFNALGDPTRQAIVFLLAENKRLSVQELAGLMELSRPAVSHHVKILREAGLVEEERDGTKRYYHPVYNRYTKPLRELLDRIETTEK